MVNVPPPPLPPEWAGIETEDVAVTLGPLGGVPVAVPVLLMRPAVTSAAVVV
jgi:hypothetical protein